MKDITQHLGTNPPPKKEYWNHSDRVLVYYKGFPEIGRLDSWGIDYYHYDPPFKDIPEWNNGTPTYWWELPIPPTELKVD